MLDHLCVHVPYIVSHLLIDTGITPPLHVHCSPHKIPQARNEKVRKLTQEMLEKGVIQPSDSPWSSPIVLAK